MSAGFTKEEKALVKGELKPSIFFWDYHKFLLQNQQMARLKSAPFPKSFCIPKSAPTHKMQGGSGAPGSTKQYCQTIWQSNGTRSECLQHQTRYEETFEKKKY